MDKRLQRGHQVPSQGKYSIRPSGENLSWRQRPSLRPSSSSHQHQANEKRPSLSRKIEVANAWSMHGGVMLRPAFKNKFASKFQGVPLANSLQSQCLLGSTVVFELRPHSSLAASRQWLRWYVSGFQDSCTALKSRLCTLRLPQDFPTIWGFFYLILLPSISPFPKYQTRSWSEGSSCLLLLPFLFDRH